MKNTYILCLLMAFLVSCKNKGIQEQAPNATVISIDVSREDILNISTFVDSLELIPLETKDENLVGRIPRIIATKDCYYLLSASGWHSKKLLCLIREDTLSGR